MESLYAVLLGCLQGATEFLPISSSGHLVLAEFFLGLKQAGLTFDVALHMGTLFAILLYFRNDFFKMSEAVFAPGKKDEEIIRLRRLSLYLVLATIPGALAGLFLEKAAETLFRSPLLVAATLTAAGVLLLAAERVTARRRKFDSLTLSDALLIGLSQTLAIVPGVSRSGITMTMGLFCGFDRPSAARFSFLLSAPIILGAGLHSLPKIIRTGLTAEETLFFLVGILSAGISGYLVIAFLLRYIKTNSFAIFAYYRFALSAAVVAALLIRS